MASHTSLNLVAEVIEQLKLPLAKGRATDGVLFTFFFLLNNAEELHVISLSKRERDRTKCVENTGKESRGLLQKPNTHSALLALEQGIRLRPSQPT